MDELIVSLMQIKSFWAVNSLVPVVTIKNEHAKEKELFISEMKGFLRGLKKATPSIQIHQDVINNDLQDLIVSGNKQERLKKELEDETDKWLLPDYLVSNYESLINHNHIHHSKSSKIRFFINREKSLTKILGWLTDSEWHKNENGHTEVFEKRLKNWKSWV